MKTPSYIDTRGLLKEWLKSRGFDGICCPGADDCACFISDLMPCGEGWGEDALAGFKVKIYSAQYGSVEDHIVTKERLIELAEKADRAGRVIEAAIEMRKPLEGCGNHDHHGYCQNHFVSNPCPVKEFDKAISEYREVDISN